MNSLLNLLNAIEAEAKANRFKAFSAINMDAWIVARDNLDRARRAWLANPVRPVDAEVVRSALVIAATSLETAAVYVRISANAIEEGQRIPDEIHDLRVLSTRLTTATTEARKALE